MEVFRHFKRTLDRKIKSAVTVSDVFQVSEMDANLFLGIVLLIMTVISILCFALNEVGVFSAEKTTMRYSTLAVVAIQLPIMILNQVTHGEPKWMKGLLEWGLLLVCGLLAATLGHNVTLAMVIPIILSLRYCDAKFTKNVAAASVLVFFFATLGNAYFGILNLNMYKIAPGESLHIAKDLRQTLLEQGIDHTAYFKSLIINDFIPRLMTFAVISFSCIKISERSRSMAILQDEVTSKASRIETELNLATQIQAGMLPCIFPAFPDHGELELFASNAPAKEVGGDFYDYFRIDDDHIAIVMADVSGKGVGAALFMTISKIVIKNQLLALKSPSAALTEANRQLCENNEADLFVTTWAGVYEVSTGELRYTNAGHNPPIIRHQGGPCTFLKGKNGLVLAGLDGIRYSESKLTLEKGDEIFLYTDGVTEATSEKKELFGDDRLLACLDSHGGDSVKAQISAILEEIRRFTGDAEQFDDITMMGMIIQ